MQHGFVKSSSGLFRSQRSQMLIGSGLIDEPRAAGHRGRVPRLAPETTSGLAYRELARETGHSVTMFYRQSSKTDSPGKILAKMVADGIRVFGRPLQPGARPAQ